MNGKFCERSPAAQPGTYVQLGVHEATCIERRGMCQLVRSAERRLTFWYILVRLSQFIYVCVVLKNDPAFLHPFIQLMHTDVGLIGEHDPSQIGKNN